jgi:hypothetical protein
VITNNKKGAVKMKRETVKNLFMAALMICVVAGASYGLTVAAMAAENKKAITMPTVYNTVVNPLIPAESQPDPEKYYILVGGMRELSLYTLTLGTLGVESPLEKDPVLTANDITMEQAAEIGVEAILSVYDTDPAGKEIEMTYYPSRYGLRAYWEGRYNTLPNEEINTDAYIFEVDSVSGEVRGIYSNRRINSSVAVGSDPDKEEGGVEKYKPYAEEAALKYGAVGGVVNSMEFHGQGRIPDPYVMFLTEGENGSRAIISISRHDNTLVGITYEPGIQASDNRGEAVSNAITEFLSRAAEYFEANPDTDIYEDEETGFETTRSEVMASKSNH